MIKFISLLLFSMMAMADTPPPNTVKAKMWSGDGATQINATGNSLNMNVTNLSLPVIGTFWQATQPVSLVSLPSLAAGSATIGNVNINGTVPISGTITATNSANGATGTAVPAQATQVGGSDGTNLRALKVSGTGVLSVDGSAVTQPVSAASLPLPAGASTAAGLTTINTTLGSPFQVGGSIGNTSFGATQATAASLNATVVGPTGATLAKDSSLTTINTTLGTPMQNTGGSVTANAGTNLNTSLLAVESGGHLASVDAKVPALGQALAAASVPVVLTASQLTTLTPLSTVAATQSGTWNLNNISGTVSLPTGAATAAGLTTINTTLGTPFQASGSIGNTSFGATQATAANLNATVVTTAGATVAKDSSLTTINTTLGTPFQAGGSIGNTTFAATQATAASLNATVVGPAGAALAKDSSLTTINTTLGTPIQQTGGTVTANAGTGTFAVSAASLPLPTGASTSALQTTGNTSLNSIDTKVPTQGQKTMSASLPVTIASDQSTVSVTSPDTYLTGQAAQTATVNNILPASAGATATDVSGYQSITVQVVSTGTGGTFIFEGSNDNTNFQALPVFSQLILTGSPITAAIAATSSSLVYTFPATVRYIRLRIATTITGGSIQAFSRISQQAWIPAITTVSQATAANLATTATIASGTVTTVSTVSSVTSDQLAIPGIIADVASGAIITTTTTATLTPTFGVGYKVTIPVTVVSGTLPTMVVAVQESGDTGTNWNTVYTFPTIIATGYYESPALFFKGNRVRYVQTIGGTTPSFTRAINRLQMSAAAAAPVNNNATFATATVSTSCSTLTAPANAVAFILENLSSNTVNMFWTIGATAATSTTGMLLEPGRDTGEVHAGQNISLCSASGTPTYSLQWIQQ